VDIATVIGLIVAWIALFAGFLLEGGRVAELFNLPALLLVVCGTFGAAAAAVGTATIRTIPAVIRKAFVRSGYDPHSDIDLVVSLARRARREGILSLEQASRNVRNDFLRQGVEMIVDGTPGSTVREVMESEIAAMRERHRTGQGVFTTLGGLSPTLGIIGTVLGLISMLARLAEPGRMGHAIAAAFIATLYGVALANLLYLPIAGKLKARTTEEALSCEMILEGLLSIQAGDNPRLVEARMTVFLPPKEKAKRAARQRRVSVRERLAA